MSFKFPFSTYHELNLDWILKKVETLSVNAEADASTIATYEERLQTAETQAQNAETSAANAQSAATSAASVAENALTTANSAQSSADASGALASQAATKADAAQSAAESARQAAETAQATAANFDGRITSAEQQASEALNMAQSFDEQARAAITTANNAANVATEAQATANATALELARQRTALETIGSQQTSAINSAGAAQVTAINSAGAAQVTAINNAGQAVLDSIPADYMNGVELVKDYTLGLYPQVEADYAPILSFENGADNIPVKDLRVNIIPNQSGTGDPSPSNIRPISGWTGVKIQQTDVNMWDEEWELGRIDFDMASPTWGQNIDTLAQIRSKNYIRVAPSETYYCVYQGTKTINAIFYDSNKNPVLSPADTGYLTIQNRAFTIPSNASYIRFYVLETTDYTNKISINHPSTDTTYHPYTGSQLSVTFPSSAGTVYGGTLTINPDRTGTLVVDMATAQIKDIDFYGTDGQFYSGSFINTIKHQDGKYDFAIADRYKTVNKGLLVQMGNYEISVDRNGYLQIRNNNYTTSADFKTAERDTQIVYELATPITYTLTTSEISGFLSTLYGANNVWADAGNTSLTYRADLGLYITENSIANYTKFAGMIAGVETGITASKTYNTGDYFIVGQKLYKALTSIATGATFTLGTNCEETTVGAELVLAQ